MNVSPVVLAPSLFVALPELAGTPSPAAQSAQRVAVRQIEANGDVESPDGGYDDFIDGVMALAEASGRLATPAGTETHPAHREAK